MKSLLVIPNPNDGRFAVSYQLPQNKEGALTIINQLGEIVYKEQRPQWSILCMVHLPKLPKGIYLITIDSEGKKKSVKFVRQ